MKDLLDKLEDSPAVSLIIVIALFLAFIAIVMRMGDLHEEAMADKGYIQVETSNGRNRIWVKAPENDTVTYDPTVQEGK